ncbi:MAG: response regulator [Myxococcaceae bacterium]
MSAARIRVDLQKRTLAAATYSAEEGPASVLVVDPDERGRSLLAARLMAEGFEVTLAESSEEALHALSPGRPLPSVVVAEAALSGEDGFELCQQIRSDSRTAFLPVLLLTREADETAAERANTSGADDLLPRPVYVTDIVAMVQLLSGRDTADGQFNANVDAIPVHRMLRALLSGVRAGRLEIDGGSLSFRNGRVVDAQFGALRGETALGRLLLFGHGDYSVRFGPALSRAELAVTLEDFCRRYEPMVERWRALCARCVPLDSVLAVDFAKLSQHLAELPDEVNAIVRLFDGRRSVRACLSESTFTENLTLEAATRLYVMGVLAPVEVREARVVKSAPRFFEPVSPSVKAMGELFGDDLPPVPEQDPLPEPDWALDRMDEGLEAQLNAFNVREVSDAVPLSELMLPSPMEVFAAGGTELGDRSLEDSINAALVSDEEPIPADELVLKHAEPECDIDVVEPVAAFAEQLEGDFFKDLEPTTRRRPVLGALAITVGVVAVASGLAMLLSREPAQVAALPELPVVVAPLFVPAPKIVKPAAPTVEQGIALYEAGMKDEAVKLLSQTVAMEPANAPAWLMLGVAQYDNGDAQNAETSAKKALELDAKNSGRARMLLASIYIEAGKHDLADAELKTYLADEPAGAFSDEARQLLERKRVPKSSLKVER